MIAAGTIGPRAHSPGSAHLALLALADDCGSLICVVGFGFVSLLWVLT